MANSVLNILIKMIKDGNPGDKETIKALNAVKGAILDAAAVGGALIGAGLAIKKGLDETVGSLVTYANEVRNVQNATGASAEDSSKLIQILDDQKISYEQLSSAIQKNGKTYDFSIAGIANMSDAYGKLKNTQDQAAFMQARFGKQWLDFVPIMQQGKDSILGAADAVEKNLVLTQKSVDESRQYERALDDWNDAIQGLKISIGTGLLPVMVNMLKIGDDSHRAAELAAKDGVNLVNATREQRNHYTDLARAERDSEAALKDHGAALDGNTESAKANAEAIKEVTAANQSMLGLIGSIANEQQNYNTKQTDTITKMNENRAEAEKLYPWQKTQLDELNKKYADMQATYDQNAQAHAAAMNSIQFDLLKTRLAVDGLDQTDMLMLQKAGVMWGIFTQDESDAAAAADTVTQAIAEGKIKVEDMHKAIDLLPKYKSIDIVMKILQQLTTVQQAVTASGSANYVQQLGNGYGYAAGGISTGPASGHMELLHGVEAVIPLQNGSIPVQLQGAGNGSGAGDVYVSLTIASPMTIMDEQTTRNTLLPFILQGVREAKARGAI
jgi:hypothetical protein